MKRRLLKKISGPGLVLALGLACIAPAEADAIYSVKDLGPAGSNSGAGANLSGRDLLLVDDTGAVSKNPAPYTPWAADFPVPGMGNKVFAPGVSEDGHYVAGTILEKPAPGQYPWVAYYAHDGQAVSLGRPDTPGSFSAAYGVNNSGQVVGASSVDGHQTVAFVDTSGRGMVSLGTLGGPSSTALGINNLGLVVGQSSLPDGTYYGSPRAFVDSGHKMLDLNTLVSPDSGFLLASASGVNDAGQIATYGVDSSGTDHILLLTPITQPVPEPGPLALFGLALTAGAIRRRSRKREWAR
jgi:probable HAF family extracellular repeat protein